MTPEGWGRRRIGELVTNIGDGGTPRRDNPSYFGGDVPWVVIQDIKPLITVTKNTLTKEGLDACSAKLWPKNAVILSTGATIGEVGIAGVPLTTKQGITGMVCEEYVVPKFLYYLLQQKKQYLQTLAQGSTIREVRPPILKQMDVNLPPKFEQKKIAAILSSVDDAIHTTLAVIDQTHRVKQGMLQHFLTHGIGHTRFKQTEIGDIPETWKVTTTGQICTSIVPGRDKPKCFDGDIPWLTISDIDGLKVNESKLGLKVTKKELQQVNGKTVPKDAVLMTCVGTFGIVAVAGRELVMNQQLHGFVCGSEVLPLYLCLVLQTKESEMKKISGQTTIPYLNKAKCESIRVPLPPIIEQNQIVYKIVSIEENINANKKYLDCLSSLKRGLMQDLLTGRMRVGGST